jgi:hypothetical protein
MNQRGMSSGVAVLIVLLMVFVGGATWYIARLRSENEALRFQLAEQKQASVSPAPQAKPAPTGAAAEPAAAAEGRKLSEGQRAAMVAKLHDQTGLFREVWFTVTPNNSEATAYKEQLASAFKEAGWDVRGDSTNPFSLRPGIYFLMADENPPDYVHTALDAFDDAGIEVKAGRGYREFNESKKKEDPNWRGFDMAADQTYIIAVGPKP